MNSLPLRIAEPKDASLIALLINAAFRVERFFIEGDRTNPDQVLALLETGNFLIIEEDGRLIGCVYVEQRGEHGYLGLLAVDPTCQKRGLGASLVAAAEAFCRAAGCRVMELKIVNLRTELPGFYNRLGYIETGTAPFPAAVQTKLPCYFVKMSKMLSG
ncbi:MAG: GNAT family N-acetyltransferase [Acidobacteria bacterium]|nr:GNAT family N-acetyltransferase [Acidobacteriota bacterium]